MNNKKHHNYKRKYSRQLPSHLRNFGHKSNVVDQKPSTSCTVKKIETEPLLRDTKGRRIIKRNTLYEDPDLFNFSQVPNYKFEGFQEWLKSGEDPHPYDDEQDERCVKQSKIQRELNKMLAKPVQLTKAERMMEKMGWQGGALGKHGDGIVEPIVPNASYATKTFGFGQTAKRLKSANKNNKKDKLIVAKEYFDTNVLFHVLDFVKNDSENEVAFDRGLSKKERKWVHNIVDALGTSKEVVSTDFDTMVQIDIAQEIFKFNNYLLTTESEGTFPNRNLCLYKEAPETMYLVTPDDLKEDPKVEVDDNRQCEEITKNSDPNNSVALTVSENQKVLDSNDLLSTVIEYFTEFVEDNDYEEFRFLGPFNSEEIDAINNFINKCTQNQFDDNDMLRDIFNNNIIELKENCNGNIIFCKANKNCKP